LDNFILSSFIFILYTNHEKDKHQPVWDMANPGLILPKGGFKLVILKTLVQSAVNTTLGFFYPEVCALCHDEEATAQYGFVGPRCRSQVQLVRPPFCQRCGLPFQGDITASFECANCRDMKLYFSYARSAAVAKTVVLEAIHHFKYSRALWFENFLAGLLIAEAAPVLRGQKASYIVPVPLHPLKKREREFNQAETLAARLSEATGIPVNEKLLIRVKATETQTHLRRGARAENMRGAFALREGAQLNGERIVVLDDVLTTGATTNDCARALRAAGAGDVCVWTVARGL
jgi:competence protein ComFC